MAPPNIAVYTSHEKKEILTSEANGTDKETVDTTVVKAWMRNEKKISGMILKANLHNATFPSYDLWRQYDTVPNSSFVTGFDTTILMDNAWNHSRFLFNSSFSKVLTSRFTSSNKWNSSFFNLGSLSVFTRILNFFSCSA